MKKTIISSILGLLGGMGGALIFEPIGGIFDIIFNEFALGGILVGIVGGIYGSRTAELSKKLGFSVGVGLGIFLIFALLSGQYVMNLLAGAFIGILVGLASHYLGGNVTELVNVAEDKIEDTLNKNA